MRRRPSIRTRLALIASAAVAVTALLVCGLAWLILRDVLIHQVDQELQDVRNGPISEMGPPQAVAIHDMPLPELGGVRVQVMLPDGRLIVAPSDAAPASFDTADQAVVAGRTAEVRYTLNVDGTRYRVETFRTSHGLIVRLLRSLANQDTALRRVGIFMIILTFGAAVVAAMAGRLVATAGLLPVHRLTRAATRVADTRNLRQPIPTDGNDELARLGHAFNRMLIELDRSQHAQRELIEDAAHELRTPMASMRTNVELLIRAGSRLADADRDALLADLDRQSIELSDLVADLVALARSASAGEPAAVVDLDEVVSDAIDRATTRTPQARFTLESRPVLVRVQPAAVERAVVNLLDNAVKFSSTEQTVEVTVAVVTVGAARFAEVSVADRGPGVPTDERERIFQRFHRVATARGVPGSGLGLAIVHQTITAHNGTVTVEPRPGGGSVFRLRVPAVGEAAIELHHDGRAGRRTRRPPSG